MLTSSKPRFLLRRFDGEARAPVFHFELNLIRQTGSSTTNRLVLLYFAGLGKASWATRRKQSATSLGKCFGTFRSMNSAVIPSAFQTPSKSVGTGFTALSESEAMTAGPLREITSWKQLQQSLVQAVVAEKGQSESSFRRATLPDDTHVPCLKTLPTRPHLVMVPSCVFPRPLVCCHFSRLLPRILILRFHGG